MTTKTAFHAQAARLGIQVEENSDGWDGREFGVWAPTGKRFEATDTHFLSLRIFHPGDKRDWGQMIIELDELVPCDPETCECECWDG